MFGCLLCFNTHCLRSVRGHAEVREPWSFDGLFKESDSIAIVRYNSTVEQNSVLANPLGDEKLHVVVSTLKIEQSLKGDLKNGDELRLTHWRLDKGYALDDCPHRSDGKRPRNLRWEPRATSGN